MVRSVRVFAVLTLIALAISPACKCGQGPSEQPSRYIAKNTEMVIEIPNVGALVERREAVMSLLEGVATPQQITEAQSQLNRLLGFDPTTKEGLAAAGLPERGPAAVALSELGRSVLWIVPIGDREKLEATLEQLVKARAKIDATKQEQLDGRTMTVHSAAWGPDTFPVAAYVLDKSFAFVGLGRKGPELIKTALALDKDSTITSHPEYAPLAKAIGDEAVVRAIVPDAAEVAEGMSRAVTDLGAPGALAKSLRSVGWAAYFEERSVTAEGRFRFDEAGVKTINSVFKVEKKAPQGVLETQHQGAALVVQVAGDPQATLQMIAPRGSTAAVDLERAFASFKAETGVDVRDQLVPMLTGHASMVLGIGDLSNLQGGLQGFLANPAGVLWSLIALGVKSEEEVEKSGLTGGKLDGFLQRQQLSRDARKVGDREITVIQAVRPSGEQGMIMESFLDDGAWIFANSAAETDRLIKDEAKAPSDPLDGKGGFFAELRLAAVGKAARSLDLSKLTGGGAEAMVIRSILDKALQVLDRLDRLEVRLEPAPDGAVARMRLTFAQAAK